MNHAHDKSSLRILFVNRMAATERGGGETFDLEIARHLAELGHEVTFLSNRPLFSRRSIGVGRKSNNEERRTKNEERCKAKLRFVLLRSPMFPWFPWDRVKGGWRVRTAEFWVFEKLAALWAWRHRSEFDIIQVCELPTFVATFKRVQCSVFRGQFREKTRDQGLETRDWRPETGDNRIPTTDHRPLTTDDERRTTNDERRTTNDEAPRVVLRLTAPNVHDPVGGIQAADAVIASGTSIAKIRKQLRPDCYDVPNGVDLRRFQAAEETGDYRLETGDYSQKTTDCRPPTTDDGRPTTDDRRRTTDDRRRTTDERRITLLYVARFQAFKNHALLLAAYQQVIREEPNVILQLAGSGPLRGRVEELANECGVSNQVEFLGEVPYEELPAIYAAADVKVVSSEYESFCFAAIEAMASGLPVVTTDCGWVPKLIGDELSPIEKEYVDSRPEPEGRFEYDVDGRRIRAVPGGRVVGRTDAQSLAAAIVEMIREPVLRAECGRWNRAKAEREHGWEASAKKLEKIYLGARR